MVEIDSRTIDGYAQAYDRLQQRFGGKIEVVESTASVEYQDPDQLAQPGQLTPEEYNLGFRDISAKISELDPFIGRVVLYPNRRTRVYQPAVITRSGNNTQMTVLNQPFDPEVGISDGMLFHLGLKNETSQASFGAHTEARGFEAGHLSPVLIAIRAADARAAIIRKGDEGTHSIGKDVGGVPEKMLQQRLIDGSAYKTVSLPTDSPHPLVLVWHPKCETQDGLMVARYHGPTHVVKLALGAASDKLGEEAVDQVGTLVDDAIRGV